MPSSAIVVVTAILPAEYGVDPTGLGTRLGLMRPPAASPAPMAPGLSVVPTAAPVMKAAEPFRSDDTELTLPPGKGAEIKANMRRGQRFVFGWSADGPMLGRTSAFHFQRR